MTGMISTPPPIPMMPETTPSGRPQRINAARLSLGASSMVGGLAVSGLIFKYRHI
jgi:hypothetical protein